MQFDSVTKNTRTQFDLNNDFRPQLGNTGIYVYELIFVVYTYKHINNS